MSAAYLTLCNQSGEERALVAVTSSAANAVELHETTRDRDGVASMAPVDKILVSAGAAAELKPGGAHIMLMDLTGPIAPGDEVELTLQFETGSPMTIKAIAKDAAAAPSHHGH